MAEHRARHGRRPDRDFRGAVRGQPHRASAGLDRNLDPRAGRRPEGCLDSPDRREQRDRRHRARRRSVPPDSGGSRHRARSGGSCAGRAAARRGKLSQTVRRLGRRDLCDDAGRRAAQCQSGAGADDGIRHAGGSDPRHRRYQPDHLRASGGARRIPVPDAARRHGPRIRISGAAARRHGALALRQRHRRARRKRRDHPL